MLYVLKPLIPVLVVSFGAFILSSLAFADSVDRRTLARWRNLFLAVTIISFLTPNYWLMLLFMSIAVLTLGAREPFKPALYLLLLFALPAAEAMVPGFAGIRNFMYVYPFNILALVILLPLMFGGRKIKLPRINFNLADSFFWGFSLVVFALAFRETTMTDGIRRATDYFMTALPPYLVFSRVNWTVDRLRLATVALVAPLIALAAVGVVEVILHWHLYDAAPRNWGIRFFTRYLERSGLLRAYATIFGPIAFGMFLMMALSLMPALMTSAKRKLFGRAGVATLAMGLLASLSRGPWMGAAISVAVLAATTRRPVSNLMRIGFLSLALFPIVALTPFGSKIIDLLPFIGTVESSTIDYRQQLMDVGWDVAMRHPFFGSESYLDTAEMQSLVQGQGIIDIVNTYLQYALDYGLIGLSLFAGAQFFAIFTLYRSLGAARAISMELGAFCQGYLAALVSMLVVIATTSSLIAQTQEVIWMLCGMCVGLSRSVAYAASTAASQTAALGSGSPVSEPAPEAGPAKGKPAIAQPGRDLPPHLRQYAKPPS